MDIVKFQKDIIDYISRKNEFANTQYFNFQKLCTKSKEILWNFISKSKNDFLNVCDLSFFEELTPIEQIFNAVLSIYEYVSNESFYFYICPQCEIKITDKSYIADFCCSSFIFDGEEWELDKKIVIECDGYDSHHTKEQRNRDTYRENELKLNGYSVIRFTGSQIYNDPYTCFEKALYFIINENKACIQKVFDEVCNNGKVQDT